jgi:hypothetical protein
LGSGFKVQRFSVPVFALASYAAACRVQGSKVQSYGNLKSVTIKRNGF